MLVKTFQAKTMAEALRLVKAELGSDAMILSTKKEKVGGILGFFSKPVYRVTAAIEPQRAEQPKYSPPPQPVIEREKSAKEVLENSMLAPLARELKELREKVEQLSKKEVDPKSETLSENVEDNGAKQPNFNVNNIPKQDLEEIKKFLLTTLSKSQDGVKSIQFPDISSDKRDEAANIVEESPIAKLLVNSGIAPESAKTIIDTLSTVPVENANQTVKSRLGEAFNKLIKFSGTLKLKKNSPRIIALVGPTGVGKTTTTAKLAAMYALNRGNKVALITMDIFRVGAVEQLKTYSRIMGIPIEVASTPKELEKSIDKYSQYDLILIDTAGRSHKDKEKLDEMKNFFDNKMQLEVYLCLSATTKDKELEEILNRFALFNISKVVFTKIDECETLGNIVNLVMKDNLQVAYFTTGQRVPEDIELATSSKLADLIIREVSE